MPSQLRRFLLQQVEELGKAGVSALYPNDFEYYLVSLELVDSEDRVVEFFSFPVAPKNISQTDVSISSTKMSFNGVTSIKYDGFVPKDITLQGDFGRRLKVVLGSALVDDSQKSRSTVGGNFDPFSSSKVGSAPFSTIAKTGYGATKVLQAIHRKSRSLDQRNRPHRLFFYNPALGDDYLVDSQRLIINQSRETNMIWQYNLQLKALAPAYSVRSSYPRSARQALSVGVLQGATDSLVREAKRSLL